MVPANVKRGRPRSNEARTETLQAAFDLLVERGYAGMAVDAVAARAGVSKATIYKWWPDRAALAVEAFFERTRSELVFPETGSAIGDFRGQIHALAATLRTPAGGAFAAMIAGARGDESVKRAIAERWVRPRSVWGQARLRAAIADGECVDDLDVDAALSTLYSIVYGPLLLGFGVPPTPMLDRCLNIVFSGIFKRCRQR